MAAMKNVSKICT